MTTINPYEPPASDLVAESSPAQPDACVVTLDPTSGTIVPRFIAAWVDELVAGLLGLVAAKMLPDSSPILQISAAVGVFLGYFFFSEWLFSRSPGKFAAGLMILRKDGQHITAGQAVTRTLLRLIEVNPFLLGAIPAALCVIFSKKRQRLGDMIAGTIVVPASQLRK